ncbi:tyrosine-type recombinase/integrase [Sphaerimonospora cavernae]|uniref:Tyrosine-type recombinase/integrase n=1 Tax=Sphaerimonospora cavernae TaxID=1740611 RepID=A0ABV6UDW4_9ACTN
MTGLPDVLHRADGRQPAVPAAPVRSPFHVYLDNLKSEESKRTMRGCLNRIARILAGLDDEQWRQLTPERRNEFGAELDWSRLTYAHTTHIRAMLLQRGWSPAHVNKHLNALRRVLKEAWRLELMDSETYHRAVDVESVDGTREPAGNDVPAEVVAVLLGVCDAEAADGTDAGLLIGTRDGAIVATLYSTGCRRSELAGFTMADYRPGDRSLKVRGKGDKERRVYLIPDAVARLERWIAVRGRTPGALFPPLYKGGRIRVDPHGRPKHMAPRALGTILDARFQEAGTARRTPHDFRRTYVGELLDAGVDLATAQSLVGHASPATTARYDRRQERARKAATDRLTLPQARPPHPKGS